MSGFLAGIIITDAVLLMFFWRMIAQTRRTRQRVESVRLRCDEIRAQTRALLVGTKNE